MLSIGLAGGLDAVGEQRFDSPDNYTYDGAAVLLDDGVIVAAVEQERVDRIRHSNKMPGLALAKCLELGKARLTDVERIAYYVDESTADAVLRRGPLGGASTGATPRARDLFARMLGATSAPVDPARLSFVEHGLTHAACAFAQSGFEEALVYVADNHGGTWVGRASHDRPARLDTVTSCASDRSLGRLCQAVLPFLGLGRFEEHRAHGMASVGDPEPFHAAFEPLYELLPDGDYLVHPERASLLSDRVPPLGNAGEPRAEHFNLAATLQEVMESIVLHMLEHQRRMTGQRRVAVAGGMAENPGINARIAEAGLFDEVFVSPTAYDAGCALGAAYVAWSRAGGSRAPSRVKRLDWGGTLTRDGDLERELERWRRWVSYERMSRSPQRIAELIAGGAIVGCAQGRAEFGCHALGSRNIWIDPGPADNPRRVADALGRPDSYRTLAAVVLEDEAEGLFFLPVGARSLGFQALAVRARPGVREVLGAVVAMDSRARVQVVGDGGPDHVREILLAFRSLTGLGALATTSLNAASEPTADTATDALTTLLTTGIDVLALGDFIVLKKERSAAERLHLRLSLPRYVRMVHGGAGDAATVTELRTTYDEGPRKRLSPQLGAVLRELRDGMQLGELLEQAVIDSDRASLMAEIEALWVERLVRLLPDGPERTRS